MDYNPKIAIIIPTLLRDELLMDTVESILDNCDMNICKIIIVDQNHPDTYSERKRIFYETAASQWHSRNDEKILVVPLGYECGISYARNEGIKWASRLKIPYCFITADSIKFTNTMQRLPELIPYFSSYDLIGCDILNRIPWEGKLELIKNSHFELTYIDTSECKECRKKIVIWKADIVRNFFLAKTKLMTTIRYDERLKAREHESVKGDTPVFIKNKKELKCVEIKDLMTTKEPKKKNQSCTCRPIGHMEIWTDKGWSDVKYITRHPCIKKMYRILTSSGYIECTEDHSLIINNKSINPNKLNIGDKIELISFPELSNCLDIDKDLAWLLGFFLADGYYSEFKKSKNYIQKIYGFTNTNKFLLEKCQNILNKCGILSKIKELKIGYNNSYNKNKLYRLTPFGHNVNMFNELFKSFYYKEKKYIPPFIYDFSLEARRQFLLGFIDGDGHKCSNDRIGTFKISQKNSTIVNSLCFMMQDIYDFTLNYENRNNEVIYYKITINKSKKRKISTSIIKKIETYNYNGFVYDIETENHHFCGGIGNVNLHNSFFYEVKQGGWKVGFTKYCAGDYVGEETKKNGSKYALIRQKNMKEGLEYLKEKYNLKSWIKYTNRPFKNT